MTPGEPITLQDGRSFENLFTRCHLPVFRYIYGLYGGPVEEIEDLTAETFLKAWNARRRFRGDESAALGWLLKIARNLVIDQLRKDKVRYPIQYDLDDPHSGAWEERFPEADPGPEEQAFAREQVNILVQILGTLSIEQREMVVLRYVLEWPVKRIADHLGMLENTVSVNIRRILQRLRDRWPEAEKE